MNGRSCGLPKLEKRTEQETIWPRFRLIIHWKPGRWAGTCVMEMDSRAEAEAYLSVLRVKSDFGNGF